MKCLNLSVGVLEDLVKLKQWLLKLWGTPVLFRKIFFQITVSEFLSVLCPVSVFFFNFKNDDTTKGARKALSHNIKQETVPIIFYDVLFWNLSNLIFG